LKIATLFAGIVPCGVMFLTAEFAVDLGNGLRWGQSTVPSL